MPEVLDEVAIRVILKWIAEDEARAARMGDVAVLPIVEPNPADAEGPLRFWSSPRG